MGEDAFQSMGVKYLECYRKEGVHLPRYLQKAVASDP